MAVETELERMVIRLVGDVEQYVKSINQAQRVTEDAAKRTEAAATKVEGFAAHLNNASGAMKGYAQQLLAIAGITGAFGTLTLGVQMAAEAESMKIAFGTMLQSVAAGEKMVKDLQKFAAATPMDLPTLQRATKTLLQFGIEGNEIIGTLKMLGDVTGGEAEKFQRMALAFGQMSGTGRLMGEELNQMIEAGFNPLKELSRTSKKTLGQLREEMEKGLITIDLVVEAFKTATEKGGAFDGLMEKMSKSLQGLFSTMKDDVGAFLRTLGEEIEGGFKLKSVVQGISTFAQAAQKWLSELSPVTKTWAVIIGLVTAAVGTMALTWAVAGGLIMRMIEAITVSVLKLNTAMKALTVSNLTATGSFLAGLPIHPITLGILAVVAAWLTLKQATRNIGYDVPIEAFYAGLEEGSKRAAKETRALAESVSTFLQDLSSVTDPAKGLEIVTQELEKAQKEAKATEDRLGFLRKTLEESQLQHTWLDTLMLGSGLAADVQGDSIRQFIKEQILIVEAYRERVDQLRQAQKKLEPSKMAEKLATDLNKITDKLKLQTATAKMSADQAKIYEIAMKMQGDATVGAAAAAAEFAAAEHDAAKAEADLEKEIEKVVESLKEEIALHHLSGSEAKAAALALKGATGVRFDFLKQLMREIDALNKHKQAMEDGKKLAESVRTPMQKFADEIDRINSLYEDGAISPDDYIKAIQKTTKEMEDAEDQAKQTASAIGGLDAVFSRSAEAQRRIAEFREVMKPAARASKTAKDLLGPGTAAAENLEDIKRRKQLEDFDKMLRDKTTIDPYDPSARPRRYGRFDTPFNPPLPYTPKRGFEGVPIEQVGSDFSRKEFPLMPKQSRAEPIADKKGVDLLKDIRDILKDQRNNNAVTIEAAGFDS